MVDRWTPEKDNLLITNWETLSVPGLEELLGFEKSSIHRRANYLRGLGILLPKKNGNRISEQTEAYNSRAAKAKAQKMMTSTGQHWIGSAAYRARLMAGR